MTQPMMQLKARNGSTKPQSSVQVTEWLSYTAQSTSAEIHAAPTLSTSTLSQMKMARRTPTCFLLGRMSFFHHISIV